MGVENQPTARRTYVSYIDRTREFYAAQGYDTPYRWAHFRDVPFTRLEKPLAECTVALVTTARPLLERSAPDAVRGAADQVWSENAQPPPARLLTDHLAWDKEATHTDDVESFLPVRGLQGFVASGRIGALAARFHSVPTDYSQRRTCAQDAPEILARCRADGANAALLVPL
jgi:hypothetical protein